MFEASYSQSALHSRQAQNCQDCQQESFYSVRGGCSFQHQGVAGARSLEESLIEGKKSVLKPEK